jgi:hypothetical protein
MELMILFFNISFNKIKSNLFLDFSVIRTNNHYSRIWDKSIFFHAIISILVFYA